MSEMAAIERWWLEDLSDLQRDDWLRAWQAGDVPIELVETLPPDQRSLKADRWVFMAGTSLAGQVDAQVMFSPDLDDFLRAEYEKGLVDE